MPQSGGKIQRAPIPTLSIEQSVDAFRSKLAYRLAQKGSDTFASKHEIVGILAEEYDELIEELRIDTQEGYNNFAKELLDIGVACIFGHACITSGALSPSEWELKKEDTKEHTESIRRSSVFHPTYAQFSTKEEF
jgi:hypothetical protein